MLSIDGSYGEGGGQILRTAIALATITGKQIEIENIRANRPNPGLQAQHLATVHTLAKLCTADVDAQIGSTRITFKPHKIKGGKLALDIGTAGSVSLVLQALTLPAIHSEVPLTLEITGGTNVNWSPTVDYMQNVFTYYLKLVGVDFSMEIDKYGFYPEGGGRIKATIKPCTPKTLSLLKRSGEEKIELTSVATEDLKKATVAERQAAGSRLGGSTNIKYVSSKSTGSSILAVARYNNCVLGFSSLGEKGKTAENVGMEAAIGLKKQILSNGCIDEHMADQILPFLAFAKGKSEISVAEVTSHAKTNMWLIEQFLPVKFNVNGNVIKVNA